MYLLVVPVEVAVILVVFLVIESAGKFIFNDQLHYLTQSHMSIILAPIPIQPLSPKND